MYTSDEVKAKLEFVASVLGGVAKFTSNDLDDKLAAGLSALAEQDWFVSIIVNLMNNFSPDQKAEFVAMVKEKLSVS